MVVAELLIQTISWLDESMMGVAEVLIQTISWLDKSMMGVAEVLTGLGIRSFQKMQRSCFLFRSL